MKKIILLVFVLLFKINSFGQQFELKGKVVNQNKTAVEFVITSLLKDNKILVSVSNDSLGNFEMKAAKGTYKLLLEQFGTEYLNKEIILDQNMDFGLIEIKETVQLESVTIQSRKKLVEQKVDRLVFNVENSVTAAGGTALDALKATPTVRVQNEVISIVGKGEILVMIDDRLQKMPQEDLAAFLKSIPSDNIKSIEVITTPPAKYDAEGSSGLINIKLKTAKANSWNANIGSSYIQKTYAGGNLNGLFTYNQDKLSLQTSISKGTGKLLRTSESKIYYPNEVWKQETANKTKNDLLSLSLGIDYKLSTKWSAGMSYLGSFNNRVSVNNPFTTIYTDDAVSSYIASDVKAENTPKMNSVNLHNTFVLDSLGKNISVDLDYFNYQKDDYRFFSGSELGADKNVISNSFFSSTNSNLNKINNYSATVDFTFPAVWANLSFGAKAFHTNTSNNLAVYDNETGNPVLNTNQSNVFNYKEYNQALYFSGSKKINPKWETQIGLRFEATQTKGFSENLNQTNTNNYIKLFPTAYVTYVPNENNTFSLNYSRRIRRPGFDYLNPFVIKTSPYYYSEGNPYLKPSIIDNFEFSFIRNQKWVNSVYFSQVSDFGQELSIIDYVTNVTRSTPLNYADTYQIGFSTSYNFNKWSWWNSFTGFNLNHQNVKSKTDFINSIEGYNGYIYTNNDFTINHTKTLFLGLNYGLQLPGRYQIFNISTLHILDVSVKVLTLNKKLAFTIVGEDLLNAQKPLISYQSNGIKTNAKSYSDTRGFRISLSYKFGNQKIQSKQSNFGNEEERNRAN